MTEEQNKPVRSGHRRGGGRFDQNSEIGAKLRALYGSVEDEGVPEKFLDLLEKLDEAERRKTEPGAE